MIINVKENSRLIMTEEFVTMSDGVGLYTRCAYPIGVEKCPTVFFRTPYELAHNGEPHNISYYDADKFHGRFIECGYAVVVQHCRGKGDSEGICTPYENEQNDGLETLDFIRSLPFYNGEIFVSGGSYLATVHLSYLAKKPHDIKGACIQIQTDRMFFRNYRNGLNYRLNNIGWWSSMKARKYPNAKLGEAFKLPYIDASKRVFGEEVPEFTESLIHNTCDEYWQNDPKWNAIEALEAPTLFCEGWYDMYIDGMVDMWRRLPEKTKEKSAMIIGPYGHDTSIGNNFEYSMQNGNIPSDFVLEWFNSIREKRPFRYAECGKINYYSIGADEWHTNESPNDSPNYSRFFFGEGVLSPLPQKSSALTYRYDPANLENKFKSFGIFRAHEVGSSESILSFVSEPAEEEKSFFGTVKFHLNVSSDCEDTAFFARLYFVEGESAYNLAEALGSLVHLFGDYTPKRVVPIDFETAPIGFTLKKGMRLRVDIASETGNYLPHANVKGHFAYVTESKVAQNTVYTDGSYFDLPNEK